MKTKVNDLQQLIDKLSMMDQLDQKLDFLSDLDSVQRFTSDFPKLWDWIHSLSTESRYLCMVVLAIGQGDVVFGGLNVGNVTGLEAFLQMLRTLEKFYDTIGGIAGYQLQVMKLLEEYKKGSLNVTPATYLQPQCVNIEKETKEVKRWIRKGLESLPQIAEIYPVGGAGDRLSLICDVEQEPLPAAQLLFLGRTLLEGLIRDLQAREYLYYKLFSEQVVTPVGLMTSHEKRNHYRMGKLLKESHYFHRPADSFVLFTQPLVPMVTDEGDWVMNQAIHPKLKPGGHGAIWKLAIDQGVFEWFESLGRSRGIVRQINNPIAGTDHGLLSFCGVGFEQKKQFGFASCARLPNNPEGTDVVVEKKSGKGYSYTLSNIEYTDFKLRGIEDRPVSADNPYSPFPSNTNILFYENEAIRKAHEKCPIPGMLINMKTIVRLKDREVRAGRLESTMQNISDVISYNTLQKTSSFDKLPSFITFNKRRKTLSVAKNAYNPKKPLSGTPEGCFYEYLQNMHDLFANYCGFSLPDLNSAEEYLEKGPTFCAEVHPAMGPLYSVISQKIRKGSVTTYSEMKLEIADVRIEDITLDGSLFIEAEQPLGAVENGVLQYGEKCGKCVLKKVHIINEGVDRSAKNQYWKNSVSYAERFHIRLEGHSEFYAEDVTFRGNHHLVVPHGHRMIAREEAGQVHFEMEPLGQSWSWHYQFSEDDSIQIFVK